MRNGEMEGRKEGQNVEKKDGRKEGKRKKGKREKRIGRVENATIKKEE